MIEFLTGFCFLLLFGIVPVQIAGVVQLVKVGNKLIGFGESVFVAFWSFSIALAIIAISYAIGSSL